MVDEIKMIEMDKLRVSPLNVRKKLGDITELKNSIKSVGLLQPIVVRPIDEGYEVIIGQRRYFACKELGYEKIPAIIKILNDKEALELSLIENIQIKSLDPIDRGEGVKALIDIYSKEMPRTKAIEYVAQKIGISVRTIYTWLEVLKSTEAVKEMVRERKLDIRTAARIASLPKEKQEEVARYIVKESLDNKKASAIISAIKMRPEKPITQIAKEIIEDLEEYSITVSVPGRLYKALMEYAKRNKLTIPEVIRRAISNYLKVKWYGRKS